MLKNRIVKSWRTTIVGVALIAIGAFLVYIEQPVLGTTLITAGLGFVGYKE
jgi:hypothetical protein